MRSSIKREKGKERGRGEGEGEGKYSRPAGDGRWATIPRIHKKRTRRKEVLKGRGESCMAWHLREKERERRRSSKRERGHTWLGNWCSFSDLGKLGRDLVRPLLKDAHELACVHLVIGTDNSICTPTLSSSSRSSNAMNVVLHHQGHLAVDDVLLHKINVCQGEGRRREQKRRGRGRERK